MVVRYARNGAGYENKDFLCCSALILSKYFIIVFGLVWFDAEQFFSHVGTEPPLPGYYQFFFSFSFFFFFWGGG